jgi:hypothetical protein
MTSIYVINAPFEPTRVGDENIRHPPVLQLRDDLQSKLGIFRLGNPQAEHLLDA